MAPKVRQALEDMHTSRMKRTAVAADDSVNRVTPNLHKNRNPNGSMPNTS